MDVNKWTDSYLKDVSNYENCVQSYIVTINCCKYLYKSTFLILLTRLHYYLHRSCNICFSILFLNYDSSLIVSLLSVSVYVVMWLCELRRISDSPWD